MDLAKATILIFKLFCKVWWDWKKVTKHFRVKPMQNDLKKKTVCIYSYLFACFSEGQKTSRGMPLPHPIHTPPPTLWSYLFLCGLMSFLQPGRPSVKSCVIHSFLIWVTTSRCIPMQSCKGCMCVALLPVLLYNTPTTTANNPSKHLTQI